MSILESLMPCQHMRTWHAVFTINNRHATMNFLSSYSFSSQKVHYTSLFFWLGLSWFSWVFPDKCLDSTSPSNRPYFVIFWGLYVLNFSWPLHEVMPYPVTVLFMGHKLVWNCDRILIKRLIESLPESWCMIGTVFTGPSLPDDLKMIHTHYLGEN
jgi:hypothetical protein